MTRLLMTADAVGGVWQYATELAAALRPHGVDTVLAVMGPCSDDVSASRHPGLDPGSRCLSPTGEAGSRLKAGITEETGGEKVDGLKIIHTGLPLDWLAVGPDEVLAAGDALATLAREVDADLVHLNSPALAARARFPAPVVAVAHGCVSTWWHAARGAAPDAGYAWHGELMAAGLRAADVIVAPSAAFGATLQQTYDLPAAPMVVHNGRAPLSLPDDVAQTDAVFTAGRLWDEVKNTPLLDRVAGLIDVPIRAAGPIAGPSGGTVAPRHLDLLGNLGEAALARELAARPIYVSAAMFEPFGLSVLEAAAAGCPLVLSDIDTFRELWTGAALFVPEQDEHAYAAAIARIRADDALRVHLGEAARLRSGRYLPDAMAGAMAAIYAGLAAEPHRVAA